MNTSARGALADRLPPPGLPVVLPTVERPPLVRPHAGRMIGGVASGLADHLGIPVRTVRFALIVMSIASGAGALLYVWLWALVPSSDSFAAGPRGGGASVASGPGVRPGTTSEAARDAAPARPLAGGHLGDLGLGVLLLVAAAALLGARFGWAPPPGVVLPVLVVIAGAVLAYTQLDRVERGRWAARTGVGARAAVLRVVGGLVIVMIGVLLVFVQGTDLASAGRTLVAVVAVLGGTALVLAPWGVRFWRDLDSERAARVREEERADIAAHLHDSVLQTLALIQRHSGDSAQVARLARAQERDLRGWLYGPKPNADETLAAVVRAAAADVEDRHGVAVDLVVVGDAPVDDQVAALVAALREAMVNAVRHAGAPVSVYVEAGPSEIEAFVRDRGSGFDLASVPPDRLGVRESIISRIQRHGGSAKLRSDDDGTEVRLIIPREDGGDSGPDTAVTDPARNGRAERAEQADGVASPSMKEASQP